MVITTEIPVMFTHCSGERLCSGGGCGDGGGETCSALLGLRDACAAHGTVLPPEGDELTCGGGPALQLRGALLGGVGGELEPSALPE